MPGKKRRAQPNVILCTCDQLRAFEVGCYGNDFAQTPNIDRLAARGTRFDLAVSNTPVCSPARASIYSGQHARVAGDLVTQNLKNSRPGKGEYPDDWLPAERLWFPDPTVGEVLLDAGYETALIGKWHVDAPPSSVGFEQSLCPSTDAERYYGTTYRFNEGEPFIADGFAPDFELEAFQRAVQRRDPRRPLFVNLNLTVPHMPIGAGNLPPPHDGSNVDKWDCPLRENVWVNGNPAHDDWWFKIYTIWDYALRQWAGQPDRASDRLPSGFDLRDLVAAYYGAVRCTDHLVGRMIEILEDADLLDNAIVLVTSDHGDNLGSHGDFNKDRLWEESIRIPFIVYASAIGAGEDPGEIAQLIDVMPTVLDLAGVAVPEFVHGRSLAGALRGESIPRCDGAFIETAHREIGIRSSRYLVGALLAEDFEAIEDERFCAYDLMSDPYQRRNLVQESAPRDWETELRALLLEWHRSTPRRSDWRPPPSWGLDEAVSQQALGG